MQPSEMTDEQLRLAIAAELGDYCSCEHPHFSYDRTWGSVLPNCNNCDKIREIPNYPGDIEAALGLIVRKVYDYRITDKSATIINHFGDKEIGVMHVNTIESIARAISEAAYAAMKGE